MTGPRGTGTEPTATDGAPREVEPVPLGPPRPGAGPRSPRDDDPADVATPGRLETRTTVSTRARAGRVLRGRSRLVAAGGVLALAVVGAAVALDAGPGSGDPAGRGTAEREAADGTDETAATLEAVENEADPNQAFARAGLVLQEAGTFAYRGEARADAPTAARPGPQLGRTVAVDGVVDLPSRVREVVVDRTTVRETLISGRGLWVRQADLETDLETDLAGADWVLDREVPRGAGLVALPDWLLATRDRTAGPLDQDGHRTFTGLLPAGFASDLMGGATGATAAVTLTVDANGNPVHVDVGAAVGSDRFALRLDIDGIGDPVDIAPPGGVEVGITPTVTAEEVVAAGVPGPVQLRELPPGWMLVDVQLRRPDGERPCAELLLTYGDVADRFRGVGLTVTDAHCVRPQAPFSLEGPVLDDPASDILGNGWTVLGSYEEDSGVSTVAVTDGVTQVDAFGVLPLAEMVALLESLGPYDRLDQPSLTLGR